MILLIEPLDNRGAGSDPSSPSYIGPGGSGSHSEDEKQTHIPSSSSSTSLGPVTAHLPNAQRTMVSCYLPCVKITLLLVATMSLPVQFSTHTHKEGE